MQNDFKTYLVSYRHEGQQWNLELPATSLEDAEHRLSQLHFAKVDGELIARLPEKLGPFAAILAATRNLLARTAA